MLFHTLGVRMIRRHSETGPQLALSSMQIQKDLNELSRIVPPVSALASLSLSPLRMAATALSSSASRVHATTALHYISYLVLTKDLSGGDRNIFECPNQQNHRSYS